MKENALVYVRIFAKVIVALAAYFFGVEMDNTLAAVIAAALILVVVVVWSCWKNHSLSAAAKVGDRVMEMLKSDVVEDELVELIEEANKKELASKEEAEG